MAKRNSGVRRIRLVVCASGTCAPALYRKVLQVDQLNNLTGKRSHSHFETRVVVHIRDVITKRTD